MQLLEPRLLEEQIGDLPLFQCSLQRCYGARHPCTREEMVSTPEAQVKRPSDQQAATAVADAQQDLF